MTQTKQRLFILKMKCLLFILSFLSSICLCCDVTFPNGTETKMNWWQCEDGPIQIYNITPYDAPGKNYEYPIYLNAPVMMKVDGNNENHVFTQPNLRATVNLWSWGGWNTCSWTTLPTLGLLNNLDACAQFVNCPIPTGAQEMDITVDFTPFQAIINMLKDNAPYQLQILLHDNLSGDNGCMMIQARVLLK